MKRVLIVICLAVFLISGYFLLQHYRNVWESKETYNHLAELVAQTLPAPATQSTEQTPVTEENSLPTEEIVRILPEYEALYGLNSDLVGWLRIDGTNINYPVMQHPEDPDYYLYRDFYKNSSKGGSLYIWPECDVDIPSDNITIYGHNTRGGAIMFHALNGYTRKSFWEEHRYIQFDTLTEHHTYEVLAVFKTSANLGEGFSYHSFTDAEGEAEFNEFVEKCKALAFYDTGVTAGYGDKLISLSTCEYTLSNGRLVVVAKRIEE